VSRNGARSKGNCGHGTSAQSLGAFANIQSGIHVAHPQMLWVLDAGAERTSSAILRAKLRRRWGGWSRAWRCSSGWEGAARAARGDAEETASWGAGGAALYADSPWGRARSAEVP
jgi:hypothetical protein